MNAFALKPAGFFGWWLSLSALFLGAVWCPAQQQGGGRAPGVVADPFNETDDEDLKKAVTLYETGEYEKCLEFMEEEDWLFFSYPQAERLQARSLQKLGRYEEAANMIADSRRLSTSMEGFLILAEIFRTLGKPEESKNLLRAQGVMRTPGDRLAFGRSLLLRGAEAKLVLENYYNPVLKGAPNLIDGYLYSGELALEKHDYKLAAQKFRAGLEKDPDNTELKLGLARTFFKSDRPLAMRTLDAILERNPHHVEALFLQCEHFLLIEGHDEINERLDKIEKVNKRLPKLWAMRSVIAHIEGDVEREKAMRALAFKDWEANPDVHYEIGTWLASKMRYEGAVDGLREALKVEPDYLKAKVELAQLLLRMGEEEEAWPLMEEIAEEDPYNVAVYNMLVLHDEVEDYQLLKRGNFIVRMEEREVAVYGDRVLELLELADKQLHQKYGFTPEKPILVEFYPDQRDFGVRTFGFMQGDGFLGVCFGNVVVINSPGGLGAKQSNWESTLWHEYAHAVTLGVTKNRIPRWLTEGISVYEERLRDPACGEQLTRAYRKTILDDELIPLNFLNQAFVRPKTPEQMMFAYYESSIAVEYLLKTHGEEALRQVLKDLGDGKRFNDSLAERMAPFDEVEKGFFAFARETAGAYGGSLDFSKPDEDLSEMDLAESRAWSEDNPENYWGRMRLAGLLLGRGQFDEPEEIYQGILKEYPEDTEAGSPYWQLALLYREKKETAKEREQLQALVSRSTDWRPALLRLMEIDRDSADWPAVEETARRYLAINPFVAEAQSFLARSLVEQGRDEEAVAGYRRLLTIGPPNPSQVHYQLAVLLKEKEPAVAKRHVLDALIASPRYRDAQKLLKELSPGPAESTS